MATYAVQQDLVDRDEQMLWNLAIDRTTDELNDTWIDQALEQADEEIDSFLGRRYVLPLPSVPGMLNKVAITIAFYWLADRDNQATDLIEKARQWRAFVVLSLLYTLWRAHSATNKAV